MMEGRRSREDQQEGFNPDKESVGKKGVSVASEL
jgi:hypothetical protein